jgi:hypothetical protein
MCSLSSLTGVKPGRSPTNSYPWTSPSEGLQYNIHLGSFTTYQASTYILIHSYILIHRKIHIHSHAHTTQYTFSTGADIVLHTYIHTYSDLVSSFTYSTYLLHYMLHRSIVKCQLDLGARGRRSGTAMRDWQISFGTRPCNSGCSQSMAPLSL